MGTQRREDQIDYDAVRSRQWHRRRRCHLPPRRWSIGKAPSTTDGLAACQLALGAHGSMSKSGGAEVCPTCTQAGLALRPLLLVCSHGPASWREAPSASDCTGRYLPLCDCASHHPAGKTQARGLTFFGFQPGWAPDSSSKRSDAESPRVHRESHPRI